MLKVPEFNVPPTGPTYHLSSPALRVSSQVTVREYHVLGRMLLEVMREVVVFPARKRKDEGSVAAVSFSMNKANALLVTGLLLVTAPCPNINRWPVLVSRLFSV